MRMIAPPGSPAPRTGFWAGTLAAPLALPLFPLSLPFLSQSPSLTNLIPIHLPSTSVTAYLPALPIRSPLPFPIQTPSPFPFISLPCPPFQFNFPLSLSHRLGEATELQLVKEQMEMYKQQALDAAKARMGTLR